MVGQMVGQVRELATDDAQAIAGRNDAGVAERNRAVPRRSSSKGSLASSAGNGDADASSQRKEHSMAKPKNGNEHHNSNENAAAPESIFTKPVPEGAAKKVSEVLGEITWLMSQSPLHKQFFISDLEWFVMAPVLLQQFRLFYDKDKPIGVVFWATVNDEVEERLESGTSRLRPQDWKSGNSLWVVEVIAPFGGSEEMVRDLKTKVFAERTLKVLVSNAQGREIRTV